MVRRVFDHSYVHKVTVVDRLKWVIVCVLLVGAVTTVAEPLGGPFALFWSRGQTWIMDTGEGVLYNAPHLYAEGPGGILFEYTLEAHSERISSKTSRRPYGHVYRWVSFERHLLGGQQVNALTNHFKPDDLRGDFNDEHQILQFTGEWVTLSRWVEQRDQGQHLRASSAYTINLGEMKSLSSPKEPSKWLNFVREHLPDTIPNCLAPTDFAVRWELPGQRPVFWVLMTPSTEQHACPYTLSGLRVSPPAPYRTQPKLTWRGDQLADEGEVLFGGVVDALIHPTGDLAILLEGPPRAEEKLFIPHLDHLIEPNTQRFLTLWRRGSSPTTLSFPDHIEVQRLDGARWLSPQSSLLQILKTHFNPLEPPPCFQRLESHPVHRYKRPPPPPLKGHLCRVEAKGRVWSGVRDLSASVSALQDRRTLFLDLWVQDPDRSQRDEITLWFGDPRTPHRLRFNRKGILGTDRLRDQVLFKWTELPIKKRKKSKALSHRETLIGYRASIELPLALVQGHLSARLRDIDPELGGAEVQMWVIGEPPAAGEPVRPTEIEVK